MNPRLFRPDPGPASFSLFDVHVRVEPQVLSSPNWRDPLEDANVKRACLEVQSRADIEALARFEPRGSVLPLLRVTGRRADPRTTDFEGVRGIVLRPETDGLPTDDILDQIAIRSLPVVVHLGRPDGRGHWNPERATNGLASRLPGPLILAHLGAFPCDAHRLEMAVDLAARHERLYLDTSLVWLAGFLTHAAARVPEKLVFGSGYPTLHPRVAWDHVASAIASDPLLEDIGWRHAEAIFDTEEGKGGAHG